MLITQHSLILRDEVIISSAFSDAFMEMMISVADLTLGNEIQTEVVVDTERIYALEQTAWMSPKVRMEMQWMVNHCKHFNIDYVVLTERIIPNPNVQ